jgi:hypothetical protein
VFLQAAMKVVHSYLNGTIRLTLPMVGPADGTWCKAGSRMTLTAFRCTVRPVPWTVLVPARLRCSPLAEFSPVPLRFLILKGTPVAP